MHLREGERGDVAAREAREVAALLVLVPEELERLRQADGLVRRQQRGERTVLRRHHRHRFHVAGIRQTQPAVLLRDLDPERAQLAELLDVFLRDLARAVDHVRVHAAEEVRELVQEG